MGEQRNWDRNCVVSLQPMNGRVAVRTAHSRNREPFMVQGLTIKELLRVAPHYWSNKYKEIERDGLDQYGRWRESSLKRRSPVLSAHTLICVLCASAKTGKGESVNREAVREQWSLLCAHAFSSPSHSLHGDKGKKKLAMRDDRTGLFPYFFFSLWIGPSNESVRPIHNRKKKREKGNDLSTHPISTTNYMFLCGGGSGPLGWVSNKSFLSQMYGPQKTLWSAIILLALTLWDV